MIVGSKDYLHKISLWMYDSTARLNFFWEWNTCFCFNILVLALQYSRLEIIKEVLLVLLYNQYFKLIYLEKKKDANCLYLSKSWIGALLSEATLRKLYYFPQFNFIIFIIWKEQMLLFTVINQINLKPVVCLDIHW